MFHLDSSSADCPVCPFFRSCQWMFFWPFFRKPAVIVQLFYPQVAEVGIHLCPIIYGRPAALENTKSVRCVHGEGQCQNLPVRKAGHGLCFQGKFLLFAGTVAFLAFCRAFNGTFCHVNGHLQDAVFLVPKLFFPRKVEKGAGWSTFFHVPHYAVALGLADAEGQPRVPKRSVIPLIQKHHGGHVQGWKGILGAASFATVFVRRFGGVLQKLPGHGLKGLRRDSNNPLEFFLPKAF